MALDFGMAEPVAPPASTAAASHNGKQGNNLGLSAEEEQTVHEEGRRAGVVVRIKSLKKSETLPPEPAPAAPEAAANGHNGHNTSLAAAAIVNRVTPPAKDAVQMPMFTQMELLPATEPASPAVEVAELEVISAPEVLPAAELAPRPEPMPEPPPIPATGPSPEPEPEPEPIPDPIPPPKPEPAPRQIATAATVPASSPLAAEPLPPASRKAPARPAQRSAPATPAAEKPKSKRGRKSLKEVAAEAELINIPEDEVLFSKQYYTMGEVAEMFRVNQSLLRFWETEFSIVQPKKNKKGDRYFRPIDIKNLHLIYHLLRQRKYTIEGAKEFLRKNKKADERFEAIQRLQQIKAFLLELKAQL